MNKFRDVEDVIRDIYKETAKNRQKIIEIAYDEEKEVYDKDNDIRELMKEITDIIISEFIDWIEEKHNCRLHFNKDIDNTELYKKLFYNKDGKELFERIWEAINAPLSQRAFILERIIKTEISTVFNKLQFGFYKTARGFLGLDDNDGTEIWHLEIDFCGCNCDFCPTLSGDYYDLDEIPQPPFHPNCDCSIDLVPEPVDLDEMDDYDIDDLNY